MSDLSLPFESKYVPLKRLHDVYRKSIDQPEEFWAEQAHQLDWFKTWDKVLEWKPPFAHWFAGGQLNASHICVDRHVKSWRRSKVAIYWEGEPGDSRVLSYSTLYGEVNRFAAVLKNQGIVKGDKVGTVPAHASRTAHLHAGLRQGIDPGRAEKLFAEFM